MHISCKNMVVLLSLFLLLPISSANSRPAWGATNATIQVQPAEIHPGDTMRLAVGIEQDSTESVKADIYIKIVLPDGTSFYLVPTSSMFSLAAQPLVKNWPVSPFPLTEILALPLPASLPHGRYFWWLILDTPGNNLTDNRRIISQDSSSFLFTLSTANLSNLITLRGEHPVVSSAGTVNIQLGIQAPATPTTADLYVLLEQLDGTTWFMDSDGMFKQSNTPKPLIRNWQITAVPKTALNSLPVPAALKNKPFTFKIVLTKAGSNPMNTSSIISTSSSRFNVTPVASGDQITYCPPESSVESCFVEAWPSEYSYVNGTPIKIRDGYNPCNYDLAARDEFCTNLENECNAHHFPSQSLCQDPAYRQSACGKLLSVWCDAADGLDALCSGQGKDFCYNFYNPDQPDGWQDHGMSGPQICDQTPPATIQQACYEKWCAETPSIYQCVKFPYRIYAYCATGTPDPTGIYWPSRNESAKQWEDFLWHHETELTTLPGEWKDPTTSAGTDNAAYISIDPYFAQRFDQACQPVIAERMDLCDAFRQNAKAILPVGYRVNYFNIYQSPLLAYDPRLQVPVFYPPQYYKLCSFGPEIKIPPTPDMLPTYTQSVFDELDWITYLTRQGQVLSEVSQQGAAQHYQADVLSEVQEQYNAYKNQLKPLLQNFNNFMNQVDQAATMTRQGSKAPQPSSESNRITAMFTGPAAVLQDMWNDATFSISPTQTANIINARMEMGKPGGIAYDFCRLNDAQPFQPGDTTLHSCVDYTYNKYFSYSRLRDEIIAARTPFEVVQFAYEPHKYALGWAAAHNIGVVRKNGREIYRMHIDGLRPIDINYDIGLRTNTAADYQDYSSSAADKHQPQLPLESLANAIAAQAHGEDNSSRYFIPDGGIGFDDGISSITPSDTITADDGLIYFHPLAGSGIKRSKNLFVELFSAIKAYNQAHPDQNTFMRMTILEDNFPGINSNNALLQTMVNENWNFYLERVQDLACSQPNFTDSGFDDYRDARLQLLQLLIARARMEKTVASLGITFNHDSDEENRRVAENSATYAGALNFLVKATTLTAKEKEMISGELAKPVPGVYHGLSIPGQIRGLWNNSFHLTPTSLVTQLENTSPEAAVRKIITAIDAEIEKILTSLTNEHPECFSSRIGTCDWLPEQFVEQVTGLIPDAILNHDYDACTTEINGAQTYFSYLSSYTFELDDKITNAPGNITEAKVCNVLHQNIAENDSTNTTNLSDSALCTRLSTIPADYTTDTLALEDFFQRAKFWQATANSVGYYLLFKNNGIIDMAAARQVKDGLSTNLLFLGVSYSDYTSKGGDWLGIEGGYGLGAGIAGVDKLLRTVLQAPSNSQAIKNVLNNDLKASLFGHVYSQLNFLKQHCDLFHFTLFVANHDGFNRNTATSFQPGINQQVLQHGADKVNGKSTFVSMEVLGHSLYQSQRAGGSCEIYPVATQSFEVTLFDKTFMLGPIPVRISSSAGLRTGMSVVNGGECAVNWPDEENGNNELLNVSLVPEATVYGRLIAGVGFNAGVLSAIVGLEGSLDLLKNQLPLRLVIVTSLESQKIAGETADLPIINFTNDLRHIVSFGSGYVAVAGEAELDLGLFTTSASFRSILYDFRNNPLWKREHKIYSLNGQYKTGQILQGMNYFQ